jgi:hypothetical protein
MSHKHLGGSKPFPGKHKVLKGTAANHLTPGKVKEKKGSLKVNSYTKTGVVKGPLKVSGKGHTSKKKTHVKA